MTDTQSNAKGYGVKDIPREAWWFAGVVIVIEIAAVAVNIDLGRPTDQLLSFIATINSVLLAGFGLFIKQDQTRQSVDALRNGELDSKLRETLGDELPPLVGAILDARGIPKRDTVMSPDPSAVESPGVDSLHDSTPTVTPPSVSS